MPDLFAGTAAAALTLLIGMLGLLVDLGFSRLGMRLFRRRKRSRACS
jgi:hypothetical protein